MNVRETMDNNIKKLYKQKNLIECLEKEDANTKNIWIKDNTLMEDEEQEPYEQYISDSINFWNTFPKNDPHSMFKLYHSTMAKKYDKTFIKFMEAQGYATFRNWMYFGKTALSKHFIQQFTELQEKYREKPFIINGSVTMEDHMDESISWKWGLKDTKRETNIQLKRRRRHSGGDVIRSPKRVKLDSLDYLRS